MSDERIWEEEIGVRDEDMREAAAILSWLHSDPHESVQPRLARRIGEIRDRARREAAPPSREGEGSK